MAIELSRIKLPTVADIESLGSLTEGEIGYDDTENFAKLYNGTVWVPASLPNPVTNDQLLVVDTTQNGKIKWADSGAIVRAKEIVAAYLSSNTAVSTGNPVIWNAEEGGGDPSSIFDTSNGRITPTRAGWYWIEVHANATDTIATNARLRLDLEKNGSGSVHKNLIYVMGSNNAGEETGGGGALVYANGAGDYFRVLNNSGATRTILGGSGWSYVNVMFVAADYAGSLATPKFRAYRTSNGSAIASAASAILFNVATDPLGYDSHNAYSGSTGKFTAPVAGVYHFDTGVLGAGAYATTTDLAIRFYKNGALYSEGESKRGVNVADTDELTHHDDIKLAAGDTVEVRVFISTGNFTAYGSAGAAYTHFSGHLIRDDAAVPASMETTTDVSFASNWGNIGGVEELRYFKDPFGIVHLEGAATRSSSGFTFNGAGATIFTLPVGYRPEKLRAFMQRGHDGTDYYPQTILVNTDGTVVVAGASGRRADGSAATAAVGTQSFLDGITFRPVGV